jgi:hypothetical protein
MKKSLGIVAAAGVGQFRWEASRPKVHSFAHKQQLYLLLGLSTSNPDG